MNRIEKTGFTLIELMVGLAISLLLMGGGVVAMSQFGERREVLADAKLVADHLRSMRTRAVSIEIPEGCDEGVSEYRVVFGDGVDQTVIKTVIVCVGEEEDWNLDNLNLSSSSFPAGSGEIDFQVKSGETGEKTIYVCGEKEGFRIDISANGLIAVPVDDFSGCTE